MTPHIPEEFSTRVRLEYFRDHGQHDAAPRSKGRRRGWRRRVKRTMRTRRMRRSRWTRAAVLPHGYDRASVPAAQDKLNLVGA